jgi:hypothetical protein
VLALLGEWGGVGGDEIRDKGGAARSDEKGVFQDDLGL